MTVKSHLLLLSSDYNHKGLWQIKCASLCNLKGHIAVKPLTLEKETEMESRNVPDTLIVQSLAKLDQTALGVAIGVLFGLVIFFATNILILKGGDTIGPNLSLLSQYFLGYSVTFVGSFIGLAYGFVTGFILGWLIAFLRNLIITIYLHIVRIKANMSAVNDFIDNP